MARIIYGYSGEGSGHSSRAREMASFLIDLGHDVRLVSYDRGYENLKDDFAVTRIEGLTIASSDNRVSKLETIRENLRKLPAGKRSLKEMRSLFTDFKPHVVVCDFEPMTAYLAEHFEIPLISLDNQHRMRYVEHSIPEGSESQSKFTRRLIRAMVPWPSVSLVTAFVPGEPTNDRTFVFPPLVRSQVQAIEPSQKDHLLVYLTSGFDSLIPILKEFPGESFFVYGYDRDDVDGNLTYFKSSQEGFVQHLASSKAVIATAGFTLISEALHLRKPYFALPMKGQYEQELNAWQLKQSGLGTTATPPTVESVGHFLYRLSEFRSRLNGYPNDSGQAIKKELANLVANDGQRAREYRRQRS